MAFDLEQLQADAQTANDVASRYLTRLRRFLNARTDEGVAYSPEQKAAVRAAAVVDADVLFAAASDIKAQHDANP